MFQKFANSNVYFRKKTARIKNYRKKQRLNSCKLNDQHIQTETKAIELEVNEYWNKYSKKNYVQA